MHTLWQPFMNMVDWRPSLHYAVKKNKQLIQLRGFRSCDAQTPSIPNNQTEIWQHKKSSSMLIPLFQGIELSPDTSGEAVYTTVLSYRLS